jgi:hypothetical protein
MSASCNDVHARYDAASDAARRKGFPRVADRLSRVARYAQAEQEAREAGWIAVANHYAKEAQREIALAGRELRGALPR